MSEEPNEKIDPETAEIVRSLFRRLSVFEARENEDCPICGNHVSKLEQVGRCVYARPCGCRIWQGQIPEAWKD